MFKLVIQDDEGKTTVVPLIRDEITIGRKEGNTIRLTERNVSRRHARILRNNGDVQIEDLGSYNGIRVNNARIAERVSLRPSDQVQIGDYKLYLKAEGMEHVDEARTMPHERVGVDTTATDVMPVPPAPPPTQPMTSVAPTTPVPGTLVGNPNRTLVSLSDTDQQGRPVATPSDVEKLMSPVGYGKLVVLSSNFAGREFELSRPQMIIGRTEDNDIVINHRSISRNHAKLVREPDTGRYTISDLQSSNGVRVNGQDYGKVELRRGDVIDLGHVRLRFIEPGEDFVFARDAVITDVPDSGGRRGLLVAILLSLVVLGVVGAFVALRGGGGEGGDDKKPDLAGSGVRGGTGPAAPPDATEVAVSPPPAPDASEATVPATPDAAAPSAGSSTPGADIELECLRFQSEGQWADLDGCSDRLKPYKPQLAKELKDRAVLEGRAAPRIRAFEDAMRDGDLRKARTELDAVPTTVSGHAKIKARYEAAEQAAIRDLAARLERVKSGDCREFNQLLAQERTAKPSRIAQEAARLVRCTPAVAATPPPAAPPCNFDELVEKGRQLFAEGQNAAALATYEQAIQCRADQPTIQKAFIVACNMRATSKAKTLWRRMATPTRGQALGVCVRNGITEDELNN